MILRSCMAGLLLLLPGAVLPAGASPAGGQRWDGRYLGVHLGAVRTDGRAELDAFDGVILPFDVGNGIFPLRREDVDISALGGAFAGAAWQRGGYVLGVEADISLGDLAAESSFSRTDDTTTGPIGGPGGWPFNGVTTTTRYATEIDALVTLRLRAGIALDDTLVYATGGLAAGSVTNRFSLTFTGYDNDWDSQDLQVGYAVGVGLEHAFSPEIGLRAEVMHFDLRDTVVKARDEVAFPGEAIDYRFENRGQMLRLGISYRF